MWIVNLVESLDYCMSITLLIWKCIQYLSFTLWIWWETESISNLSLQKRRVKLICKTKAKKQISIILSVFFMVFEYDLGEQLYMIKKMIWCNNTYIEYNELTKRKICLLFLDMTSLSMWLITNPIYYLVVTSILKFTIYIFSMSHLFFLE